MLCGTHSVIVLTFKLNDGIFCGILLVPQNFVTNLNNVVESTIDKISIFYFYFVKMAHYLQPTILLFL